jgi:branched-chain amino acid transport system ATP-binding protein
MLGLRRQVVDRPSADGTQSGLRVSDLDVHRAGFPIVRGVSLVAPPGKVTVVLGANGAGKTTLLEAISGVIPVAAGTLELDGAPLTSLSRRRRAELGLGHVEQGRRVFADLTTTENIKVALRGSASVEAAFELFPELGERRDVRAGMLSGGEQQMVVVARALAGEPKVLMVDEMSLGLAPRVARRLIATMRTLADERGVGILLVEQYATLALENGDHAYVLSQGSFVYDGPTRPLLDHPDVLRRAYLGERIADVDALASPSSVGRTGA